MSFLFKPKTKTPLELVKSTEDCIAKMEGTNDSKKASEEISRNLSQMKLILYGDGELEPTPDLVASLASECVNLNSTLLFMLVKHISALEFEVFLNAGFNNRPKKTLRKFSTICYDDKSELVSPPLITLRHSPLSSCY